MTRQSMTNSAKARRGVSFRAACRRRFLAFACFPLWFACFFLGAAATVCSVHAAPVTFLFDATISDIAGDTASLTLPFSLTVGQQIAGRYSFQSEEDLLDIFLHHEHGKLGQLSLVIDGVEIDAATNFGLLNSAVSIDPSIPGPTSSIALGYSSPTDVFPGWPGVVAGQIWNHQLSLFGSDGTITSPEQLLDVSVWNQLTTLRRLDLQFGFPDTVAVKSTVNAFVAIPEPSSTSLVSHFIIIGLGCFLFSRRNAKRFLCEWTEKGSRNR